MINNPLPGVPLIESPLARIVEDSFTDDWERSVALSLHRHGMAILDFPDPDLSDRIDRIQSKFQTHFGFDMNDPDVVKYGDLRIQDAWSFDEDVRAIAANPAMCKLLSSLYGRPAFPFQTLNFPIGTQQAMHTDAVHFSSLPERFMCGVWLAMEDVTADCGALRYIPGSHRWPILTNVTVGRRGTPLGEESPQSPYHDVWDTLVTASGIAEHIFLAKKGQALIWCANLLHGGGPRLDERSTRWSQVTHYLFDDCIYYTPAFSNEPMGDFALRNVVDVATNLPRVNSYLGNPVEPLTPPRKSRWNRMLQGKPREG
ncbi:phytanoyl-CoA dioxygenase family protein [Sphingobium limneticum]|uniref:phytanoyl-CoA dioxygenase family protein n=1 Tax=Sphingobium TaxID=165695 RepID=UPI003137F2B1